MKILGLDPGVKNFGWAAIEARSRCRPLGRGMMRHPINNITMREKISRASTEKSFPDQVSLFRCELSGLLDLYDPDLIVAERFQARGLRGIGVEAISMMTAFAIVMADIRRIDYALVTASTWKNAAARAWGLRSYDDDAPARPSAHEKDAALIAVHGADRLPSLAGFGVRRGFWTALENA